MWVTKAGKSGQRVDIKERETERRRKKGGGIKQEKGNDVDFCFFHSTAHYGPTSAVCFYQLHSKVTKKKKKLGKKTAHCQKSDLTSNICLYYYQQEEKDFHMGEKKRKIL